MLNLTRRLKLLALLSVLLVSPAFAGENPDGVDLLRDMYKATVGISQMTYKLVKSERFNGKMNVQTSFTKIQYHPFKVYTKEIGKENGVEALFATGENGNKVLVNPNGFPWINLNLDPQGDLIRKDQHHLLTDAGYVKLIPILEYYMPPNEQNWKLQVKNTGPVEWKGNACWKVDVHVPHFEWYEYTVKAGETLDGIAERLRLSAHMILEYNEKVTDYDDVSAGQVILIPTVYAKKFELFIDRVRKVPIVFKVFDEFGLYEQFEYLEINVDPRLNPQEFSKEWPDYGF